jgi:hypothetical protein
MADRADLEQRGRDLDMRLRDLESERASGHAFKSIADLHLRLGKLETEAKRLAPRFAREQPLLVR